MNESGPDSLGKWPLAWPTVGAIVGLLCAEYDWWALLIVACLTALWQGLYSSKPVWTLAAVLSLLFACWHNHQLKDLRNLAKTLDSPSSVTLEGTLIESNSFGLTRRLFRTSSGAKLNLLSLPEHYRTGNTLSITGNLVDNIKPRNPGGFTRAETLHRRGIAGTLHVKTAKKLGWNYGFPILRGWSESIRKSFAQRITQGITDVRSAAIIQAVVLGEKSSSSSSFEDFRKTGTMHVFAVSGLHVGLVALIVGSFGRALRLPPSLLLWLILSAMLGYAFITGLRPPALRAALMGSLILGRFILRRPSSVVNNLFAAALVVLFLDTFQLWQAGFQLSFLVVAIILILEPRLWQRVAHLAEQDSYLPKPLWTLWQRFSTAVRTKVGRMFTVSFSAWIGSSPLNIAYFGWFTPISSLASVVMVFGAFSILVLALLSLAVSPLFPSVSLLLNQGNSYLAKGAHQASSSIAALPGAWTRIPKKPTWHGGLCVFDIPYGGAAVHLDAGGGVMIDAGSERNYWRTVYPALQTYNLSVDSLIATHADAEHVTGLGPILTRFPISQLLLPHYDRSHSLETVWQTAHQQEVHIIDAGERPQLPIDENYHIELLYPGNPHANHADDRGLVIRIHAHGWKILLTGDSGYTTEHALLASEADLRSDLWICGLHQKDITGTDAFINAVSPRAIITTENAYPITEQVPSSWRQWLESRGIHFISQAEHGAVFVVPSAHKLQLSSFLQGKITTLTN